MATPPLRGITAPYGADPMPISQNLNWHWEWLIHPRLKPWYSVFDRINKPGRHKRGQTRMALT